MKVCRYIENNNGHKIFEGELVYFIGIKRYDGKKYTAIEGRLKEIIDDNHILLQDCNTKETTVYNINHIKNIR